MHLIRNTYGRSARIICFLFAVHLFNFSIDPKDRQANFIPEDLTINEIESIAEFFAEVLFGFDNAFEENDEADSENGGSVDFTKIFLVNHANGHLVNNCFRTNQVKYFIRNSDAFAALAKSIIAPPPKA